MILRKSLMMILLVILTLLCISYYIILVKANSIDNKNLSSTTSLSLSTTSSSLSSLIESIGIKQFYNSDLGDGIRIELVTILRSLNQHILVAGSKGDRSPYKQYFDINNDNKKIYYTGYNGKILYPQKYNHIIHMHNSPNKKLYEEDIKTMFNFYKNDHMLFNTDAFICSYPLSFCEAYMPYNKTIIWIASHRYSLGRCSKDSWNRLNEHIIESINESKTRPKNIIAAMSKYDVEYINYFTGLNPILIESTGLLYGALELRSKEKNMLNNKRNEILFVSGSHISNDELNKLMNTAKIKNYSLVYPHKLYGRYKFEQVISHPAVVIVPHSVHTQSFVEYYALGVPIFAPTIEFLITLNVLHERTTSGRENCLSAQDYDKDGNHIHITVTDHIHHKGVHEKSHNISHITNLITPNMHLLSRHVQNPESDDPNDIKYWLKFSNIYYWPHVTYFNNWNELFEIMSSLDLLSIRNKMFEENDKRLSNSIKSWIDVISTIDKGREIPSNYENALKTLWNVDKLQIE